MCGHKLHLCSSMIQINATMEGDEVFSAFSLSPPREPHESKVDKIISTAILYNNSLPEILQEKGANFAN